jgi:hypothetical protein
MSAAPPARFYIRYAIQRWNDAKWFIGSFIVVLLALTIYGIIRRQSIFTFALVLLIEVAFLSGLWAFRRMAYIEVREDGLRLRYLFTQVELPYGAVSRVRKQPLGVAFQPAERRRYVNRFVRRLIRDPAVYIRIDRRQSDQLERLERRLGARMIVGADLVLPITDIDDFMVAVKARLRSGTT